MLNKYTKEELITFSKPQWCRIIKLLTDYPADFKCFWTCYLTNEIHLVLKRNSRIRPNDCELWFIISSEGRSYKIWNPKIFTERFYLEPVFHNLKGKEFMYNTNNRQFEHIEKGNKNDK